MVRDHSGSRSTKEALGYATTDPGYTGAGGPRAVDRALGGVSR